MIPLNQSAPDVEFEEEAAPSDIDVDRTEPVTIKFFLGELERWKRDGVTVEVWADEDGQNIA